MHIYFSGAARSEAVTTQFLHEKETTVFAARNIKHFTLFNSHLNSYVLDEQMQKLQTDFHISEHLPENHFNFLLAAHPKTKAYTPALRPSPFP